MKKHVLLIASLVLAAAWAAKETVVVGAVSSVTGPRASLTGADGKAKPAQVNTAVAEGDLIATPAGTTLRIALLGGSVLTVQPDSRVRISQNLIRTEAKVFSAAVLKGSVLAKVAPLTAKDDSFTLVTPSAVAGVRGTDFAVAAGLDGASQVQVSEGKVDVSKADGAAVRVAPKQKASADLGDKPVKQEEGADDLSAWLNQREQSAGAKPVEAIGAIGSYLKTQTASAQTKSADLEAGSGTPLTNREQAQRKKTEALQAQIQVQQAKAAAEALAANAAVIAQNAPVDKKKEAAAALGGVERIQKQYEDAVQRMEDAVARLDEKLRIAFKKVDDGFDKGSKQIEDRLKKLDEK